MRRKILIVFLLTIICLPLALAVLVSQPMFSSSPPIAVPRVDPAALKEHVLMLSETCYPRSFDQPEKQEEAARYIQDKLIEYGSVVEVQPYEASGMKFKNLIARYGPIESETTILIGAHYDSYAHVTGPMEKEYSLATHTPGADDNASGVAGLLELAGLFNEYPPNKSVILVFYATEEPPFFNTEDMGSAVNAKQAVVSKQKIDLMLSLEMIGYFSDERGSQNFPVPGLELLYPDTGNFIAIVGRFNDISATRKAKSIMSSATDLPVRSINAIPQITGIDFSDHRNYWQEGYTALMITDTSFYRNPGYHTANDTAQTLDYERMAQVVEAVFGLVEGY